MAEDRYIEIRVKNIDLNIEKEIRFLLANKNKHLLDCEIEETDDECIFRFCSDGIYSFDSLDKLSKEDKYRLLVNIADMEELTEEYSFSIAPSNLVFDIKGREELNSLIGKLRQITGVIDLERATG